MRKLQRSKFCVVFTRQTDVNYLLQKYYTSLAFYGMLLKLHGPCTHLVTNCIIFICSVLLDLT